MNVQRNDCARPLRVRVDGLPAGMKLPILTLAANRDSIPLSLAAPLDCELPSREVIVSLWMGQERIDQRPFHLSVRKVPRPVLLERENIHCKAGETTVFTPKLDRKGCREPLTVRFDNLPPGVRQESLSGPAVKLTIAPDAKPEPSHPVRLRLWVRNVLADTAPLFFDIDPSSPRVRLKAENRPDLLSVSLGQTGDLSVVVRRDGYDGPVDIRLDDLPPGVTAAPVTIPARMSSATVKVEAAAPAEAGESQVKVIVSVEGQSVEEGQLRLRVEKPAERPVTKLEEPRTVHFESVDGVALTGTFYSGPKGKKGACVLIVPDMGRLRQDAGWRRLARALQTEGHTVLALDLRGQGDSKTVASRFWREQANQFLPAFRSFQQTGAKDSLPAVLDARTFPAGYLFWHVLDLAAARMYLEKRNDDPGSSVNTANLIVIGAGQGATISVLWLSSECRRFLDPPPSGLRLLAEANEGERVAAGIWLSLDFGMGNNAFTVPMADWVGDVGGRVKIPMLFLYGEKDTVSAERREAAAEAAFRSHAQTGHRSHGRCRPGTTAEGTGDRENHRRLRRRGHEGRRASGDGARRHRPVLVLVATRRPALHGQTRR